MGKKIGSGSFGEIFLAVDLNTNKEVAIKFVRIQDINRINRSRRRLGDPSSLRKLNF